MENSSHLQSEQMPLWQVILYPIGLLFIFFVFYTLFAIAGQYLETLTVSWAVSSSISDLIKWSIRSLTSVIAMIVTILFVFKIILKEDWSQLPINPKNLFSEMGWGFLLGIIILSASLIITWLAGSYHIEGFLWDERTTPEVILFLTSSLVAFFVVSVSEETLFRSGLFHLVERFWGSWVALIISAIFFGLVHMGNPQATLLGSIAIIFEAGILLGAVYMLTRRLWVVIGIHWSWNFTQGPIFGSVISGSSADQIGLINGKFSGPEWITGGVFGMEAGLPVILICTGTGIYFLIKAWRQGLFVPFPFRKQTS